MLGDLDIIYWVLGDGGIMKWVLGVGVGRWSHHVLGAGY